MMDRCFRWSRVPYAGTQVHVHVLTCTQRTSILLSLQLENKIDTIQSKHKRVNGRMDPSCATRSNTPIIGARIIEFMRVGVG